LNRVSVIIAPTNSRHWLVGWDVEVRGNNLRKLKTLELKQSSSHGLVVDRVELSALDLTEEVVEGIIASFSCLVVVRCLRRGAIVSYWAVAWVLACL